MSLPMVRSFDAARDRDYRVLSTLTEWEARKRIRFAVKHNLESRTVERIDGVRALCDERRDGHVSILLIAKDRDGTLDVVWFKGELINHISAQVIRAERWKWQGEGGT